MTYASNEEHFSLWNEEDGFYYDAIQWGFGHSQQLPVRSMVGLIPLYATLVLEPQVIKRFPGFKKRMDWFIAQRCESDLCVQAEFAAMRQADETVQLAVKGSDCFWRWRARTD
jgi:hypothetical protein